MTLRGAQGRFPGGPLGWRREDGGSRAKPALAAAAQPSPTLPRDTDRVQVKPGGRASGWCGAQSWARPPSRWRRLALPLVTEAHGLRPRESTGSGNKVTRASAGNLEDSKREAEGVTPSSRGGKWGSGPAAHHQPVRAPGRASGRLRGGNTHPGLDGRRRDRSGGAGSGRFPVLRKTLPD